MEALSVGQVAEIFIPSWYAYGTTGAPPWIPPGADLMYEVELLDVLRHGTGDGAVTSTT